MQKFKLSHMTALYEGGIYTLTADSGYALKNKATGETAQTVKTKDYTRYEATADASTETKPKTRGKKK